MRALQITTRVGCRVACDYCPQDLFVRSYAGRSDHRVMTLDQFGFYLGRLPEEVEVWFCGMSESWLNPDCTRMVLAAHEKGHLVSTFSTLVGMRPSDVKALEPVPFGFFRVHLPSASAEEGIPVDAAYLDTLSAILSSSLKVSFHCHDKDVHPTVRSILDEAGAWVMFALTFGRSGNLDRRRRALPRRRGRISCKRHHQNNVLLPNGDVLLCSNDYGQKHVLGNLNTTPYLSLFEGAEYERIRAGMKDESLDILCRTCEVFCENDGLKSELLNSRYLLEKGRAELRGIRSATGWAEFGRDVFRKVRRIARSR